MRAAVVESFGKAPVWGEFREPEAQAGEQVVKVRAAGLSNLVKAQASGAHYSASREVPFVVGADGVGVLEDGRRVYFFGPRAPWGAMAERSLAVGTRMLPVPDEVDDVTAAALGNPAMASWGALLGRAKMRTGETVLVNGATGVAGQQAVQAAKRLGAKRVIATGRDEAMLERLKELGADAVISLKMGREELVKAFREAWQELDVVVDYVWGASAEALLESAKGRGAAEGERRVRYVQVGSISGNVVGLNAEWLRSSGVELMGSGLGSLSAAEIVGATEEIFQLAAEGGAQIDVEAVPLRDVERAWGRGESGKRIVFTV